MAGKGIGSVSMSGTLGTLGLEIVTDGRLLTEVTREKG